MLTLRRDQRHRWPTLGKVGEEYPKSFGRYPAPANHSKVFFADDQICYMGSDNLDPNSNAEFGYLLEGAGVGELLEGLSRADRGSARPLGDARRDARRRCGIEAALEVEP